MEVCLVYRERHQLVAPGSGEQGVLPGAAPSLPSLHSLSLLYPQVPTDFSNPVSKKNPVPVPAPGTAIWPQSLPNGKGVPRLRVLLRLWAV